VALPGHSPPLTSAQTGRSPGDFTSAWAGADPARTTCWRAPAHHRSQPARRQRASTPRLSSFRPERGRWRTCRRRHDRPERHRVLVRRVRYARFPAGGSHSFAERAVGSVHFVMLAVIAIARDVDRRASRRGDFEVRGIVDCRDTVGAADEAGGYGGFRGSDFQELLLI